MSSSHAVYLDSTLSLFAADNQIGAEGARALAEALRENRMLLHLYLGGVAALRPGLGARSPQPRCGRIPLSC